MTERCYVMLKPMFANEECLVDELYNLIKQLKFTILAQGYCKYSKSMAGIHYVEKRNASYFKELVDYISSDKCYGFVVEGEECITILRKHVEAMRIELQKTYSYYSITANGIHCTSKNNSLGIDTDSKREINTFIQALKNCVVNGK